MASRTQPGAACLLHLLQVGERPLLATHLDAAGAGAPLVVVAGELPLLHRARPPTRHPRSPPRARSPPPAGRLRGRRAGWAAPSPRDGAYAHTRRGPAHGRGRCGPARRAPRTPRGPASTPCRSSSAATARAGGVRSDTCRQRDRIVTSTSSVVGAQSSQTVCGAGSSRLFSMASAAWSVSRSASSTITTAQRPRVGDIAALSTRSRTSSTPIERPEVSTTVTSGCEPRAPGGTGHSRRSRCPRTRARRRRRAPPPTGRSRVGR